MSTRVIKIEHGSKYVLVLDHSVSSEVASKLKNLLDAWWESDQPFIIVHSIKLVKVKEDNETKHEDTTGTD